MGCGYRTGLIHDPKRLHWREDGPRPVSWAAWYPTDAAADATPPRHFFDLGPVASDAPISAAERRPLVLLSHGTGGVAESMGWLARGLVAAGYVVVGANHHGNTGAEPYLAEGFMCWWERARDLTVLLDFLTSDSAFVDVIDVNRFATVGFSLGGYTGLAVAGARSSVPLFHAWSDSLPKPMTGPKEFASLSDDLEGLEATSATYRASLDRQGDDYTDGRIRSVVAIAPAPPVRAFIESSLQAIQTPVTLIASGADTEAPREHCAGWLHAVNPAFTLYDLGDDVGHYTFLNGPSNPALKQKRDIFQDRPGVDRDAVQADAVSRVLTALRRDLS